MVHDLKNQEVLEMRILFCEIFSLVIAWKSTYLIKIIRFPKGNREPFNLLPRENVDETWGHWRYCGVQHAPPPHPEWSGFRRTGEGGRKDRKFKPPRKQRKRKLWNRGHVRRNGGSRNNCQYTWSLCWGFEALNPLQYIWPRFALQKWVAGK